MIYRMNKRGGHSLLVARTNYIPHAVRATSLAVPRRCSLAADHTPVAYTLGSQPSAALSFGRLDVFATHALAKASSRVLQWTQGSKED